MTSRVDKRANLLPPVLRAIPFNVITWDLDRRLRTGRRVEQPTR